MTRCPRDFCCGNLYTQADGDQVCSLCARTIHRAPLPLIHQTVADVERRLGRQLTGATREQDEQRAKWRERKRRAQREAS